MNLTIEDIKKLTEYQTEIFATKEDLYELEQKLGTKFDILRNSIDSFAKEALHNSQEISALSHRIDRTEQHLKQIADKIGLKLDY